jgi:hypothetical protein
MLETALQTIEVSEALLPALVTGLHIDMTGTGQNAGFGPQLRASSMARGR